MSNKLLNSFASKCMEKLYLQSNSADIHFVFPNDEPREEVPAHKLLLSAASPVFRAMFNGNWKENKTVDITDSNASAFKDLLKFIYLPEVTLKIGNIEEVVRLADKYDMLDCFETCGEFLEANLTIENMVWGYQLAVTLNNAQLMEFCEKHIRLHTKEILRSNMFFFCSRKVIDHILKLDTLNCNEHELFCACYKWAKISCQKNNLDGNNSENLKNQLGPCFYLIRFGAMAGEEIGSILLNKVIEGMFTKGELADIIRSKCPKRPKLELFNHQPRLKTSYTWNATNKLTCKRNSFYVQERYYVGQQESTWFSSNGFVLLGEMSFVKINCNYHGSNVSFDIEIIEHEEDNFAADAPTTQLLYEGSNVKSNSALVLNTPVLIRPHKMYEIRLEPQSGIGHYSHSSSWEDSEVKVNDKITIDFYENPFETNTAHHGLVSIMYFNPI